MSIIQTGKPVEPGLYAAHVTYGWRLLVWRNDQWNYDHKPHLEFLIPPSAFVGPLPKLGGYKPEKLEYDL